MEHGPTRPDGSGPEFVLPHRKAVTEANWAEWEAKGVRPLPPFEAVIDANLAGDFDAAQGLAGIENVWTGDAFDLEAGRPLADKPGTGIYVTEEGIQRVVQAKHDFWADHEDLMNRRASEE
jgi:hypothetical protein